jgi:aminopeptidase-like protein
MVRFPAIVCHPSVANDNLSRIEFAAKLALYVQTLRPRHNYRLQLSGPHFD